jgi:hypothetical protein
MIGRTRLAGRLLAVGLLCAAAGCSSSNQAGKCVPGASVACTGNDGCSGGQVCSSDGASYGSCMCGESPTADGGGSSAESSIATGCPPCWNEWACLDNYESLDYFSGKRNADGSCSLTVASPNDGTVDITLKCGGQSDQASSWANDTDPNGAPAIDFIDSALVLHCAQT